MNRADTQTLHQTQGTGRLEAFVRDLTVRGDDPRLAFGKIPEHAMEALISNSLGLYAWCTENIREYLPILDVKGKAVFNRCRLRRSHYQFAAGRS